MNSFVRIRKIGSCWLPCSIVLKPFGNVFLALLACIYLLGLQTAKPREVRPLIDPISAIKQFQVPPGLKIDLFVAEPEILNPVGFCFDEQGRIYVAETFRYRKSVYDARAHRQIYAEDLAARNVDDRAAMIIKYLGTNSNTLTNDSERIRLIEDRDWNGKADHSSVFADGFNTVLDGLGTSVLARKGNLYYANIPNLWLLSDTNHSGQANYRKSLSYGYGVHYALIGHDLHGLRMGPDGRLYFSIGDRGLCVTNQEGRVLNFQDTGSILRCNLDGSELEVYAYGVRNPQSIAFDNYGNLFTGDNNCDNGDSARLVCIVEGGDSGWRTHYQVSETTPAGLWNSEKLWHRQFPGQSAYMIPPVAHIANGPAGFAHYPGTGLPAWLDDHFFLCDYKSGSVNSGIHSFAVKPVGAGFEMVGRTNFLWRILATHLDFSPDGQMFVSDWVAHWPQTDKGRLYRLYDPEWLKNPQSQEIKKIIGEGMEKRTIEELAGLLGHPDQRIRLEAQFEMADRAVDEKIPNRLQSERRQRLLKTLIEVGNHNTNQLARIHALWGLGQIGRRGVSLDTVIGEMLSLLKDDDAEIRAQTARVLGEAKVAQACTALCESLSDKNSRVRFFAAQSLRKLGNKQAIEPLLAMLRENADKDVYLRHAGVMGLTGSADKAALLAAAKDPSRSVRLGVLLAMRREKLPEIALFLADNDPQLVEEAARAINDEPIPEAMPRLAAMVEHPTSNELLDWRAINANARLGGEKNAAALVGYALQKEASEKARCEALFALENWSDATQRDRVTGAWRPLRAREGQVAAAALRPAMPDILKGQSKAVQIAAIRAARKLMLTNAAPILFQLVEATKTPVQVRVEALTTLGAFRDSHLLEAARMAINDENVDVRKEGGRLLAGVDPKDAVAVLETILKKGEISEKQNALNILAKMEGAAADNIVIECLANLTAGKVVKEMQFDVLEAAEQRTSESVKAKLKEYQTHVNGKKEFIGYSETLYGGDSNSGRLIFAESPVAGCRTCHTVKGDIVGGTVGPDLAGIGKQHDREYLLESILYPNKQIAAGFENVIIKTKAGQEYAGVLSNESDEEVNISIQEDGEVRVVNLKKSDIESRQRGLSGMPEGLSSVLSKREIRDLIEYLANAKPNAKQKAERARKKAGVGNE